MATAISSMKRAFAKGDVTKVIDFRWSGSVLIPLAPTMLMQNIFPTFGHVLFGGSNDPGKYGRELQSKSSLLLEFSVEKAEIMANSS